MVIMVESLVMLVQCPLLSRLPAAYSPSTVALAPDLAVFVETPRRPARYYFQLPVASATHFVLVRLWSVLWLQSISAIPIEL